MEAKTILENRFFRIGIGILVVLGLIAAIWFLAPSFDVSGGTLPPVNSPIELPGKPSFQFTIGLLELGLAGLFVFSLLESSARRDPFLLDFFSSWIVVGLLVVGQLYGHDTPLFYSILGACVLGMVISTFFNPAQEASREWWDRIDTTHWYVAGSALIFLYLIGSSAVPYPAYVPILAPILTTIFAAGKEFFRQPKASLLAVGLGLIPAYLQDIAWVFGILAVEVMIAAFAAKQGWITVRKTDESVNIGGRSLTFSLAWDLVLFYVIEVALVGYLFYHNYPVLIIGQ